MKSNNSNYIFIYFIFIILFWLLFFFSCFHTKIIGTGEMFNNLNTKKNKLLNKVKYKCKNNQEHAYSPEICCKMVNGNFTCDHNRNCKCKNINTGYCEKCYPPVHKKNIN